MGEPNIISYFVRGLTLLPILWDVIRQTINLHTDTT